MGFEEEDEEEDEDDKEGKSVAKLKLASFLGGVVVVK